MENEHSDDYTFEQTSTSGEPHLCELNDLVRDLKLSKINAELLGSRLKGWNLLRHDTVRVPTVFF